MGTFRLDMNLRDVEGNTALHLASAKGFRDVVQHLLMKKADASSLNKKGMNIVHIAVHENKPQVVEVIQLEMTSYKSASQKLQRQRSDLFCSSSYIYFFVSGNE